MLIKLKMTRVFFVFLFIMIFILGVFGLLIINKSKKTNLKFSIDYLNDSKYSIEKCNSDLKLGDPQKLEGAYENVLYCLNFPYFEDENVNRKIMSILNSKIRVYSPNNLADNLKFDKFEFYSAYQTFKYGENSNDIAIQFQFLEKNLTKKTSCEFIQTYVWVKNEFINNNKFFKITKLKPLINEIKTAFLNKYNNILTNSDKQPSNLDKLFPQKMSTVSNFVLDENNFIFFFERGEVLPEKFKNVSVEVKKSKIVKLNCINNFISSKIFNLSNDEKIRPMVALTFDDGPDAKNTEEILEILQKNDAKSTFFVIGKVAKNHPEILKKILDSGNEIGNHTYSHSYLHNLSEKQIFEEINKTNEIVEKATDGYRPQMVRPPGGFYNSKVEKIVNYPLIMWTIDTNDWKTRNVNKTINEVMKKAADGAIILMHDIYKESLEAARVIIPELVKKGFDLVTVSELFESKGLELKKHQVYFEAKDQNFNENEIKNKTEKTRNSA